MSLRFPATCGGDDLRGKDNAVSSRRHRPVQVDGDENDPAQSA